MKWNGNSDKAFSHHMFGSTALPQLQTWLHWLASVPMTAQRRKQTLGLPGEGSKGEMREDVVRAHTGKRGVTEAAHLRYL